MSEFLYHATGLCGHTHHPSLININKDIDYYEGYEKSKKEDIDFLNSKNKKNETKN